MVAEKDVPPFRVIIEPLSLRIDAILLRGYLWVDPRCAEEKERERVLAWAMSMLAAGAEEGCLWAAKAEGDQRVEIVM